MFKSNGQAVVAHYLYADNLNSPRAITNTSGQVVWRWDGEPFGATTADENPSGLGQFSYGLRFPGQYFDAETGYHQNRWREYDPKTGRYVQSDPMGLAAGWNTYAYALSNPLTYIDVDGNVPLPMVTGVIGGALGFATSVAVQLKGASVGEALRNVNWRQAAIAGATGAAAGAMLPIIGTSRFGAAVLGANANAVQTIATAAADCKRVDAYDLLQSMAVGALAGWAAPFPGITSFYKPNPRIAALFQPTPKSFAIKGQLTAPSLALNAALAAGSNFPSVLRCLNTGKDQNGNSCSNNN